MRRRGGPIVLALAAAGLVAAASPDDWRRVVTPQDRQRLRDWRSAWIAGLAAVRAGGDTATIATDPALFGPDTALAGGAMPPAGDYRCRPVALGARAEEKPPTSQPWGRCRIAGEAPPRRFVALDGVQRPVGLIYADGDGRAIFLGTATFPDEHRPPAYAHAAGRDVAGVVERIGDHRWRLAMPYPRFGPALSLIELVPG